MRFLDLPVDCLLSTTNLLSLPITHQQPSEPANLDSLIFIRNSYYQMISLQRYWNWWLAGYSFLVQIHSLMTSSSTRYSHSYASLNPPTQPRGHAATVGLNLPHLYLIHLLHPSYPTCYLLHFILFILIVIAVSASRIPSVMSYGNHPRSHPRSHRHHNLHFLSSLISLLFEGQIRFLNDLRKFVYYLILLFSKYYSIN